MADNTKKYGNLCISAKYGESIIVGDVLITIKKVKNKEVKISFNAPKDVKITRTKMLTPKPV